MKIILSRKGFDAGYGGQPSPILPDGTLLSLPIPSNHENIRYTDLIYKSKSYFDIIKELREKTKIKEKYTCHLDPDIYKEALPRANNWKGLFGQMGSAQGHLRNNNVGVGDIFLFFGWFRKTEIKNKKLQYKEGSPDLHIIYGFLEVAKMYLNNQLPERIKYHPHADNFNDKNNCIYESADNLSFNNNIQGFGTFKYDKMCVLTKKGETKSRWNLPKHFKDVDITYHSKDSWKDNYFQSASKGQEFIIDANEKIINWTKNIIFSGLG